MKERADLGFGDALQEFNPDEWQPAKPAASNNLASKAAAGEAAKVAGFRSREPKVVAPVVAAPAPVGQGAVRRRRTGRNAQFNLKAKPETIEAFCAIADRKGWGLGETLEQAVALLEREFRS